MPRPPPQRLPGSHIPQKDLTIPTHAREARIVIRHRNVKHFIPVSGVSLDETRSRRRGCRRAGLAAG